jgi:hypothetical protein
MEAMEVSPVKRGFRHPEVLAVFGESRWMEARKVLVAILRDAAQARGSSG